MKELELRVEGMVCGGCENRVKNALKTISGVEEVFADYTKGLVTIKAKEDVTEGEMKAKIEDIRFEVR